MPMIITVEKIHEQYPRYKHITSPAALIGLIKKSQRTFDIPSLKMGKTSLVPTTGGRLRKRRDKAIEAKQEEARWSKC